MIMRVQNAEGEYRVVLSPEVMQALHLSEGAEVELLPIADERESAIRCATTEELVAAYRETEPEFRNAYLDLAK